MLRPRPLRQPVQWQAQRLLAQQLLELALRLDEELLHPEAAHSVQLQRVAWGQYLEVWRLLAGHPRLAAVRQLWAGHLLRVEVQLLLAGRLHRVVEKLLEDHPLLAVR